MSRQRLRERLGSGDAPLAGPLWPVAEPHLVEACGLAGFDFLVLDLEHGTTGDAEFANASRAAESVSLPLLVRLPVDEAFRIGRLLDAGADGIVASRVESLADVERVVDASHFPPVGRRGAGPARTNAQGTANTGSWVREENDGVLVCILIETRGALEDADAIVSHPEVNAILVGPRDLSVDLGVAGQLDHPEVAQASESIRGLCRRHGTSYGSMVRNLSEHERPDDDFLLVGLHTVLGAAARALRPRVEVEA